jgi:WD40 repeat protein
MKKLLLWQAVVAGVLFLGPGCGPTPPPGRPADTEQSSQKLPPGNLHAAELPGDPAAPKTPIAVAPRARMDQNLLAIPNCTIEVMLSQTVPAQRDGVLLYVARELRDGEADPPEELLVELDETYAYVPLLKTDKLLPGEEKVQIPGMNEKDGNPSQFRRLRENEVIDPMTVTLARRHRKLRRLHQDDEVKKGDLLALVDPQLAVDEFRSQRTKVDAAKADQQASLKTRDEAQQRYMTLVDLNNRQKNAVSWEEVRGGKLTWDRYFFEEIAKAAAIVQNQADLNNRLTLLRMHEIRAQLNGVVKEIYKSQGEAVKALDQVLKLDHHDRLRISGKVDMQNMVYLPLHSKVRVEPYQPRPQRLVLSGHYGEIKAVAVAKDRRIASASDDHTVRIWQQGQGPQDWSDDILEHPTAVLAVACTPPGDKDHNYCVSGDAEGVARIWDLSKHLPGTTPYALVAELKDGHKRSINTIAISADGKYIATGGDDQKVCVWDNTGKLLSQSSNDGHVSPVTSVQFLSGNEIVSAGRDNALILWEIPTDGGNLKRIKHRGQRGGEVPVLGVLPQKRQVLFDQGNSLLIGSVNDGRLEAKLQFPVEGTNFSTMALFSPDGKLIVTNAESQNRLQLWRAPTPTSRPYELRHLVWMGAPISCAAFAPQSAGDKPEDAFLVTGTTDRNVVIWDLPSKEEIDQELTAEVSMVEHSLNSASREVTVWAEVQNKDRRLLPGATATLVVYPENKKK